MKAIEVIYDQKFSKLGFLDNEQLFGYIVYFEDHFLDFRIHPTKWAIGIVEDEYRFISLGYL
jgi:hypothetical protein